MSGTGAPETPPSPQPDEATEGSVVTFYSYKGGVGRSMALANVAWLLANKYGKRVIVVDWDLEAPGLHRFFGIADEELHSGVIDYVTAYSDALRNADRPISEADILLTNYLAKVQTFPSGGEIRLMSAGRLKNRTEYVEKVRSFNWQDFYDNWNGGQLIEAMRTQFRRAADFTLIDSRTGLTDIGGVCTVQLPDAVVMVFVYNGQNIDGIATVAGELSTRGNPTLAALQRWPVLHFLPSRRELSERHRLFEWEAEAERKLSRFCESPEILARFGNVANYLRKQAVPYVPFFAYGENIAVQDDLGFEIREALEPLIELLMAGDMVSTYVIAEAAAAKERAVRSSVARRLSLIVFVAALMAVALLAAELFDIPPFTLGKRIPSFFPAIFQPLYQSVISALAGIAGTALSLLARLSRQFDPKLWRVGIGWRLARSAAIAGVVGAIFSASDDKNGLQMMAIGFLVGYSDTLIFGLLDQTITTLESSMRAAPKR
jgi:hypothetical protein